MELRQLRAFVEVATSGHFGRRGRAPSRDAAGAHAADPIGDANALDDVFFSHRCNLAGVISQFAEHRVGVLAEVGGRPAQNRLA